MQKKERNTLKQDMEDDFWRIDWSISLKSCIDQARDGGLGMHTDKKTQFTSKAPQLNSLRLFFDEKSNGVNEMAETQKPKIKNFINFRA